MKLTPEQRSLREQIALLSAHIKQTKRDERAAAKVAKLAEAALPKPPRWHVRMVTEFRTLRKQIEEATAFLSTDPHWYHRAKAQVMLDSAPRELAHLIRDRADVLADELEGTGLIEWAALWLQPDRRGPVPFPISHTENPT